MPRFRLTSCHGRVVVLVSCLSLAAFRGATAASIESITLPLPGGAHLTDGQDRLISGQLSADADKISQAAALYADALISFETRESDSEKALGELRKVVALDPHNDEAQIRIANVLLQTGQIESAYEQLQAAVADDRHSVPLLALLGYTQHLRGQNEDALRLSTKVLTMDPTEAASMRVLLEIAGAQDDLSGAVLHIEDILRAGGSSVPASAWLTLGRLYVEIAQGTSHTLPGDLVFKTLLPIYQEAAARPPIDVERLTLLSQAYQDLGRNAEALHTLRRALDLEPENVDVILRCGRLEMALENRAAALKDFEQAYQLNPNLSGLREMLGRTYLDAEKFTDAIRLLQDALADSPDNPALEADLGLAYAGLHDQATAAQCFQHAFASASCPPEAYLKLAVFQLNNGLVAKAGETLVAARVRFPKSAQVLFYQAIQNRYAKNYSAALDCLDTMHSLSSSESDVFDPTYYLEDALVLNLAGHRDRIEPLLREGIAKFPNNADLMNELAFSEADAGSNLPEALELSKRAAELDPDNGAITDTLGWVYFKMDEANLALPYLQHAAVLTNNDAVVLEHVGDAWLRLGHRREAIAAWRLALKKSPSDHELITRIAADMAQANHAYSRSAPRK